MASAIDPLATFWRLRARDGRLLTCAAYRRSYGGLELRVQDDRDRVLLTQLFNGPDEHLRMVQAAERARERLVNNGLRDEGEPYP